MEKGNSLRKGVVENRGDTPILGKDQTVKNSMFIDVGLVFVTLSALEKELRPLGSQRSRASGGLLSDQLHEGRMLHALYLIP